MSTGFFRQGSGLRYLKTRIAWDRGMRCFGHDCFAVGWGLCRKPPLWGKPERAIQGLPDREELACRTSFEKKGKGERGKGEGGREEAESLGPILVQNSWNLR